MAGWLDYTRRYCITTAKPILKLFRPSCSPIIPVYSDPCVDTQFQAEPLQRGLHTQRVGKIRDFRRKSPFTSETVRDRPMVTMEVMGAGLNGIIFDDLE